jgi:Ca2+-binding EF-hand superfamily protein
LAPDEVDEILSFCTDVNKRIVYTPFIDLAKNWTKSTMGANRNVGSKTSPLKNVEAQRDSVKDVERGRSGADLNTPTSRFVSKVDPSFSYSPTTYSPEPRKEFSNTMTDEVLLHKNKSQKMLFQRLETIRSRLIEQIRDQTWKGVKRDVMLERFAKYDKDELDIVTVTEFKTVLLQDLKFPLHVNEVNSIIAYFTVSEDAEDVDYRAFVKFAEVLTMTSKMGKEMLKDRLTKEEDGMEVAKKLTNLVRDGKWRGLSENLLKEVFHGHDTTSNRMSTSDFTSSINHLLLPLSEREIQNLVGFFDHNGEVVLKDFLTFCVPWTTNTDNSKSANASILKELARLREENLALRNDLAVFDGEFFEDIEDLKYDYSQAVIRNRSLQIHALDLCQRAGIDPSSLGVNLQLLSGSDGQAWKPSSSFSSGMATTARRSYSSALTSGDILKRAFATSGDKALRNFKDLEDDMETVDAYGSGKIKKSTFEKILRNSSLRLSERELETIWKTAPKDSHDHNSGYFSDVDDDEKKGSDAIVNYREFLKAVKPLAASVTKHLDEAEDLILRGYASSSISRSKAQTEKEKAKSEELMDITKTLNKSYKKGSWGGVSIKKIRVAFEDYDIDDAGAVTSGEFNNIIKDFEIPLERGATKMLMQEFKNSHGDIVYKHFLSFLEKWNTD